MVYIIQDGGSSIERNKVVQEKDYYQFIMNLNTTGSAVFSSKELDLAVIDLETSSPTTPITNIK